MPGLRSARLTQETILRVAADTILVNAALLVAFAVHFFYLVLTKEGTWPAMDFSEVFWHHVLNYMASAWLLTLTCLVVFAFSGFYTYGRAYRGRYKALVVTQAVSVAYVAFGAFTFGLATAPRLPFAVWALGWILTALMLVFSRVWAHVWTNVVSSERARRLRLEETRVRSVLVIGGAGYIGSALLPKLLDRGYRVRLLDLLLYGTEPIQHVLNHPNLQLIQADFRQIDRVVEAMQNVDAVIHLGGIVGDPACALDEEITIEVNLMATKMIAEVAKGSGVSRFILASTCSVYGASDEFLDERSALNPVSLYARSKIASEKVLMSLSDPYFSPSCLRFGTIYGLSGRTRFDLVVNLLAAKAVLDGEITVYSGDQWRPFLHVDDAALAVLTTLEAPLPAVRNQVFNVGSSEQNYTLDQVGELIQRQVPTARIIDKGSDTDRRNYRVNFNKIRRTLQFEPQWTLEKGVAQVIDAIRRGDVVDYRDAKYSNVKFLSEEGPSRLLPRQNGWAHELVREAAPAPVR